MFTWLKKQKEAAGNDILFAYHDPIINEDSCVCPEAPMRQQTRRDRLFLKIN